MLFPLAKHEYFHNFKTRIFLKLLFTSKKVIIWNFYLKLRKPQYIQQNFQKRHQNK